MIDDRRETWLDRTACGYENGGCFRRRDGPMNMRTTGDGFSADKKSGNPSCTDCLA